MTLFYTKGKDLTYMSKDSDLAISTAKEAPFPTPSKGENI